MSLVLGLKSFKNRSQPLPSHSAIRALLWKLENKQTCYGEVDLKPTKDAVSPNSP